MFDRCKKIALQCRAEYWVYGISVTSQLRSNITAGQLVGLLQREEQRCHHHYRCIIIIINAGQVVCLLQREEQRCHHHQDIETSEKLDFARKGKKSVEPAKWNGKPSKAMIVIDDH